MKLIIINNDEQRMKTYRVQDKSLTTINIRKQYIGFYYNYV